MRSRYSLSVLGFGVLAACSHETPKPTGQATPPEEHAKSDLATVTEDAYVYGYPLVLMDATERALTDVDSPGTATAGRMPLNRFSHSGAIPSANDRSVIRMNTDTLYSQAWLDLSRGPLVMHVPEVRGRFYMMQILDAWTNVVSSPGTRTTGTPAHDFAIVGPDWQGDLPASLTRIDVPTNMAWILGRTQVNGPSDLDAVHALQRQYTLQPLAAFVRHEPAPTSEPLMQQTGPEVPPPVEVARMDGMTFFQNLARLIRENPPAKQDDPALQRFRAIGFVPGQDFKPPQPVSQTLPNVPKAAEQRMQVNMVNQGAFVNGWHMSAKDIGRYGTNYDLRAAVAMGGLGANLREDAMYPSADVDAQGRPLTGANRYVIHFDKDAMPPVQAFWSITLYDANGYFAPNALNRYAIHDRDPLKRNPDGSLDVYVQHNAPEEAFRANWLPSPAGSFNLLMRLYQPKEEALSGAWKPPPVRPLERGARFLVPARKAARDASSTQPRKR